MRCARRDCGGFAVASVPLGGTRAPFVDLCQWHYDETRGGAEFADRRAAERAAERRRHEAAAVAADPDVPPDRLFRCIVCGVELHGRAATFDSQARPFCGDCVGRLPEGDGFPSPIRGAR